MTEPIHTAIGKAETTAALEKLLEQAEQGVLQSVALRVFRPDGTWQDIVLGGDEHEQAEALASLRRAYSDAH